MGRAQSSNTRARARAQSSNTRARARAHHTRTTEVAIGDAFELEPLLERVYALTEPTILDSQAHGPRHWRDVARIGLTLASLTPKADSVVVFTFALLHDSQRHNEERDREHGARAAVVANALARERVLTLTPAQLQLLLTACSSHTNAGVVTDPTLGCCQDADRLTLWRVDITPKVNYLSTAAARQSESFADRARSLMAMTAAGPRSSTPTGAPTHSNCFRSRHCLFLLSLTCADNTLFVRPQGHLAGGALAGAILATHYPQIPRAQIIAGTALAANVPDLDALILPLLDALKIKHSGNSANHHYWVTHTPLFWTVVTATLAYANKRSRFSALVPMLGVGVGVHLAQDMISNSVAFLWPWRPTHLGLELDGLGSTETFSEFLERYPGTTAWRIEWATIVAAAVVSALSLQRERALKDAR